MSHTSITAKLTEITVRFGAKRISAIRTFARVKIRGNLDRSSCTQGSDPAAVMFDAVNAAKKRGVDVLICDTAGRLQNKGNLMNELSKINKVINLKSGHFGEFILEKFCGIFFKFG